MNDTLAADKWFSVSPKEFHDLLNTKASEWTKLTPQQVESIYNNMPIFTTYINLINTSTLIIIPIGIFSSIFGLFTLWKKSFVEKNSFFQAMFAILINDLFYCILAMPFGTCYRRFRYNGANTFAGMWYIIISRALLFVLSLASDLGALILTIERYVALCWPHQLKHWTTKTAKICKIVSIVVLSLVRMHYALQFVVVNNSAVNSSADAPMYLLKQSKVYQHTAVVGLSMFSDLVLPFILMISMIFCSMKIIIFLIKRRRTRARIVPAQSSVRAISQQSDVEPGTVTNTKSQSVTQKENAETMITLILILDFLFILNQLGYCAFAIVDMLDRTTPAVDFQSDFKEVTFWCLLANVYPATACINVILEYISHSYNFFFYLIFSVSFRKEFRNLINSSLQ